MSKEQNIPLNKGFDHVKPNQSLLDAILCLHTEEEIRAFYTDYVKTLDNEVDTARANLLWCLGYFGTTVNGAEVNPLKERWISVLTSRHASRD